MDEHSPSTTTTRSPPRHIPTIAMQSVHAERLLGTGSFAVVYLVRLADPCRSHVLQQHAAFVETQSSSALLHKETSTVSSSSSAAPVQLFSKSSSFDSTTTSSSQRSLSSELSASKSRQSAAAGSGNFATTTTTTTTFALKRLKGDIVLHEDSREQASLDLTQEAYLLRNLPSQHPHIIGLYGVSHNFWPTGDDDEHDDKVRVARRFFVMEHLEGGTLNERLQHWKTTRHSCRRRRFRSRKSLSSSDAQRERVHQSGLRGVAEALEFLHAHRIIYRDLKPQNIGYDRQGRVRLFDFGFARYLPTPAAADDDDDDQNDYLMTGCVGTLRYMAPEVAAEQYYDTRADVYALGSILWEVCTLQFPYGNRPRNHEQLLQWVLQGKNRPAPRHVTVPQLRPLVTACLQPEPHLRPDSWQTIVDTLHKVEY